jgi:hypothetical protein
MKTNISSYFAGMMSVAALALAACSSALTPEKISAIHTGMKAAQVEAILGRPAHIDESQEATGLRGEVYDYPAPNGEGRVIFIDDAVFKAEFVPGGKSS